MAGGGAAGRLPVMNTEPIHPAVRVGHVHLRVADLDRAVAFYRDALGLAVTADARTVGLEMVLLAAGDYHHHVGLNTWDSEGGPPPPGHTGLYHVAFVYPDRAELGRAVRRLLDHDWPIDHGTDHGGTVSVYLSDPDGNGIELYYDRPRADWYDADGRPVLKADRFDYRELLPNPSGTPVGTGAYSGSLELEIADGFANGEGGVCAPIRGDIVLGTGSPNRLVLAVSGDSCQDGAGPVTSASFTGLARFTVKHGTGAYAKASGSGLASFVEDAADQDRMTLIGRISR
jgi:catechol 2,3-dioxygenase